MKLIGIGDNTIDEYTHIRTLFPGGNALNVAVYASRLGCEAAYLGVFGSDAAGDHMQQVLTETGIDISRCRQAKGPNGRAMLSIEDGERVFTGSNGGGIRSSVPMDFIFDDVDYLQPFPVVHTSIYSYMDDHLAHLRSHIPVISYDFSDDFETDRALSLCAHIDIAFFSCGDRPESATLELLDNAVAQGCTIAVATLGPAGAILFDGKDLYRQAPELVEPTDTLGAGDGFIAGFLVTFMRGGADRSETRKDLIERALREGARFAAEVCLVQGAFGHGLRY